MRASIDGGTLSYAGALLVGPAGLDVLDGQAGADLLIGDREDTCTSGIPLGCGGAGG